MNKDKYFKILISVLSLLVLLLMSGCKDNTNDDNQIEKNNDNQIVINGGNDIDIILKNPQVKEAIGFNSFSNNLKLDVEYINSTDETNFANNYQYILLDENKDFYPDTDVYPHDLIKVKKFSYSLVISKESSEEFSLSFNLTVNETYKDYGTFFIAVFNSNYMGDDSYSIDIEDAIYFIKLKIEEEIEFIELEDNN